MPAPEVCKDETTLLDEVFLDCVNNDAVFLPSKENKPHVNVKNVKCQNDIICVLNAATRRSCLPFCPVKVLRTLIHWLIKATRI